MTLRRSVLAVLAGVWLLGGTAPPLLAGFSGTDVFLPSVGARPGVPPSVWYTTVWVHNPNATAANVTFYLLERQANPAPLTFTDTIPPGETRKYDNAIQSMFARQTFGALRVTSNVKVIVGSRIYSQSGDLGDSVGQFFAGIPASFAIGAGQATELLGVYGTQPSSNSTFRYNFGFVETTGTGTCTVTVTVSDATGAPLASKRYTVRPWEQVQKAFKDEFPGLDETNARLTVLVSQGTGKVIAFGSLVANGSQDPSTMEMSFREELLGGSGGLAVVSHDASLSGDGTPSSPLGIARGAVSQDHLATSGTATSGKVLGTDGASLVWQSAGSGGFSLPYDGSTAATDAPAFSATASAGTVAVRGLATNTAAAINYGGYFEAHGSSGRGVAGATNGVSGWGVYGVAMGSAGKGVVGESASGDGVMGSSAASTKSGVYGRNSDSGGYGVFGRNTATGNTGSLGSFHGVTGLAGGAAQHGGYFEAAGTLAAGVYGKATGSYAYGGVFEAAGANSYGLLAIGPAGGAPGAAAIFRGNVQIRSRSSEAVLIELGEGLDLAEGFNVTGNDAIAPGSVLVIDPGNPGKLALSREPYDRKVAGIVAGANKLGSAVRLGAGQFDRDVALAGRVYCNVDATYGEVRVGDLLTTSPTPGFAMVAHDRQRATGAVLGKAMQPLAAGERGQILVLVTLQ